MPPSRLLRISPAHSLVITNAQAHTNTPVWFKLESENPTGSFKVRGAYNSLALLSDEVRARGVVASSAGNHGLGVAWAAQTLGIGATIFLPRTAPEVKRQGIIALGAQVNDDALDYDAAHELAVEFSRTHGVRFINPCLGLDLLAGQGTVALELLQQLPTVTTVLVSVGGGGLLGGMGSVLRRLAPQVRIIGVQSEQTSAMAQSLKAGHVVHTRVTPTLADGLAGQIDESGLIIGQQCADEMVLVAERDLAETMNWFRRSVGLRVEGAGAVSATALRHGYVDLQGGPIAAIITGSNVDDSNVAGSNVDES